MAKIVKNPGCQNTSEKKRKFEQKVEKNQRILTKRNRKKPAFEKTSRDQKFEHEVQQNPETFKEIEKKLISKKQKKISTTWKRN